MRRVLFRLIISAVTFLVVFFAYLFFNNAKEETVVYNKNHTNGTTEVTIIHKDDRTVKVTTVYTYTNFASNNFTEESLKSWADQLQAKYNITGVTVSTKVSGSDYIVTVVEDYKVIDLNDAASVGLVKSGSYNSNDYLSYKSLIASLSSNGFTKVSGK